MNIIVETRRFAACPACGGKVGEIDHLTGAEIRHVGPWFCEDCGRGWMIRTDGKSTCDLEPNPATRWMPCTVTIVLPPQKEDIIFTLHAHTHERPGEPFGANDRYFYDEHTCPTNWMRDVVEIQIGDNADPHGLFRFQAIEPGHFEEDPLTGALKRPPTPNEHT